MTSELYKRAEPARKAGSPMMVTKRSRKGLPAIIAACCTVAILASAQSPVSEYSVKAAYLFNFGKFVRFASTEGGVSQSTFDLCIIGEDPLGHSLDEITANEKLDGRPVRVTRFKSATEARGCGIAYISAAEGSHVDSDLQALNGQEVLTVSDSNDFLRRGGMIQFVNVANHVRFAVNLDAARKAHITLSSELLRVAISVNGEAPTEVRR